MELEWDEDKRLAALIERGLDFADFVRFDRLTWITVPDLRRDYGEPRFNTYGYLEGRLCICCWTPRQARIRVISMRKANDRERRKFEAGTL